MSPGNAVRPFIGADVVSIVLPYDSTLRGAGALADFAALLRRERRELEVELGASVRFVAADPGDGPRFLIGPASCNPAVARYARHHDVDEAGLWLDRDRHVLVANAPNLDGIREAINLLRTLSMGGAEEAVVADCRDRAEVISRIETEVGWTYPAFALRGLDWVAICARHRDKVRDAHDPLSAMRRWLAELQDCHTWATTSPPPVALPYAVWVTPAAATFVHVPPGTAAWEAGVRVGDALVGVDAAEWWAQTGAPVHARPLMAGYRLLAGPVGATRVFTARTPTGHLHAWTEAATLNPPFPSVSWRRLPSGTAYLRIAAWRDDMDAALDAAFDELTGTDRLIVDLRRNVGGNLVRALAFRDRFLRHRTVLGGIRFSTGDGGLAVPTSIVGEPSPRGRWPGVVRFLTDPLTYSASEDVLLGLQGLAHVQVIGEPSGGGSGRPRTLRLLAGQMLRVSTALTYDRQGRCIEGVGIPVDRPIIPDRFSPDAPDAVLLVADQAW